MADMKEEHQPPWYNDSKKAAALGLLGVFGAGFFKLFFKTPIDPLPDCPGLFKALSVAKSSIFG